MTGILFGCKIIVLLYSNEGIMKLTEASQMYLDSLPSTTSDETVRLYKFGLQLFVDAIGDEDIKHITDSEFDMFCQYITKEAKKKKWTPRTQHSYTRGPVGLLIYLAETRLSDNILPQALWRIRRKRIAKVTKSPYILPVGVDGFLDKLYETKPPASKKVYQRFILEHAFVVALVSSGARIHEICKLKVNDFDGKRALVKGKGGKYGYINFTDRALIIMDRWKEEREAKSPYLFPAIRKGIKRSKFLNTETARQIVYRWVVMLLGERQGITPHTFRHYIIKLGIQRKGLRWAQLQARHADPSITADYDESNADEVTSVYDEVVERK